MLIISVTVLASPWIYSSVRSEKIKVAISNLTALCYSINSFHEKNGILPETADRLLELASDKNNVDLVYANDFLTASKSNLQYSKLSDQRYEFFYVEKGLLFKLPGVFCNSDREGKNISSGVACNCSLEEQ